jgi:FkbM family methyltransferase
MGQMFMERLKRLEAGKSSKPVKTQSTKNAMPEWLRKEVEDYFVVPIELNPATILDIGANIGTFALRAHQEWPDAHITCYEPMPFNLEQLRQNVDDSWCHVEAAAVRAETGKSEIYIGDMNVTGGFQKGNRQTDQTIRVDCVAAAKLPSCELVKVDTEGCELEILRNLDLSQTQVLMLEHHSLSDAQEIKGLLSKNFKLMHDESNREVGTEIFTRRMP